MEVKAVFIFFEEKWPIASTSRHLCLRILITDSILLFTPLCIPMHCNCIAMSRMCIFFPAGAKAHILSFVSIFGVLRTEPAESDCKDNQQQQQNVEVRIVDGGGDGLLKGRSGSGRSRVEDGEHVVEIRRKARWDAGREL